MTSPDYSSVLSSDPSLPSSPSLPPGFTRSLVGLDYALVTPESRTWAAPVNSLKTLSQGQTWSNASVAHLISPGRAASGASFSMFLLKLGSNGRMGPLPPVGAAERFLFVLDGVVKVETTTESESKAARSGGGKKDFAQRKRKRCSPPRNLTLRSDGFAFFPPHCSSSSGFLPTVTAGPGGAGLVVFEKVHVSRETGKASRLFDEESDDENDDEETETETEIEETLPFFVSAQSASKLPLIDPGHPETFKLRKLLPHSGLDASKFDFNVHLMDFNPGEFLVTKEIHHNQHGLLMLLGQGIYRLSDSVWAPVTSGDAVFMGPYVTQWFGSLGRQKSRYLIFKDTAPDPLLAASS
jgi:(S)-ureidoglycine aminohydrolase